MKFVVIFVFVVLAAVIVYLFASPEENLLEDPEIKKFAKISTELAIEFEHYDQDSLEFIPVLDSILKHYNVTEEWFRNIIERLDDKPEVWVEIYDMMIDYGEKIKDSVWHRKPLEDDSI